MDGVAYKWNGTDYDPSQQGPAVPTWANYLVVNPDGSVWAFTHRAIFDGGWISDADRPPARAAVLWRTFSDGRMPSDVSRALLVDLRRVTGE